MAIMIVSGVEKGSLTARAMTERSGTLVRFKAKATNTGYFYIGGAGVTAPGAVTDQVSGFELGAGEESPWIPLPHGLDDLYLISTVAADLLTYILVQGS